jgi:hypothetical protein
VLNLFNGVQENLHRFTGMHGSSGGQVLNGQEPA